MFDLTFSETHQMIRDTARDFAQNDVFPTAVERDKSGEFPAEIVKKMGELGFMGMMVSPEWGGSGLDALSYVIAMEEISAVDASVGVVMSVNNSLVCWGLEEYGSADQKANVLTPLARGAVHGAFCLSEPEAGSDATQQHTTATRGDGGWILNGTKNWITNGTTASWHLVMAQTDRDLRHKGITCFIIPSTAEGYEPGLKEDKLGIRSSDTSSIGLTNVFVPDSMILGDVGQGFRIAMESLNGGRIGIAAQALGIAKGAFEAALAYSKQRKAFGKPISDLQAIQMKLADMATRLEAARMLVYKAAWLKDQHGNYIKEAAQAKLLASQTAVHVALEAIQIHGGYGYVREYLVERYLRDAKITEIYEGTSEIQHIVIARELLKA
ncbi:MAG: acyl-CoA dehydrogenase [Chlorobi bacterium]|nr:MAG: acyl-CoA dehydrogenase [Bacteroidota bacterium]KXK33913.1 MAG: Acyl-CoA dehydrogenase [Chlorobi bacterium OLB6]MBE2265062.1 acyl-CoA dehydrogenase [Flavobacteriales bacterium]MBL1161519.1 acyl-CoA dehydrogenase [Chlorobiota bacterium]MBW7854071.1 acyl-CoA dehydrogenase [Candidatus Kapabacteria bacterium]MCC6330564.1 acyl-CoA dehydrogenase [Ignavibacteria bacterium]